MGRRVAVRVPATTANLGPGFDALGMALKLYNTVELEETGGSGFHIEVTGEGEDLLPRDADNLVARTIEKVFRRVNSSLQGWRVRLDNKIPLQRGLGSSAAAIVGGLLAANAVAGSPFSREELLAQAIEIEGHPDNVAAALLGGIVAVAEQDGKYYYTNFTPPQELVIYAVIPNFTLSTKAARGVLPELVPMKDVVFNLGRVALLTSALKDGDWDLLTVALKDRIHQPYRSRLIPGMTEAFEAAEKAGAYGAVLSGAGPTLIAFGPPGLEIGEAMGRVLRAYGIETEIRKLEPTSQGAYIIE
ncbi:MAG TPA: homoserine kinase [Syntrophomonadaceae bacterium]|nr:homoserine kinase [Syntrophomonadaceae bacterium]